MNSVELMMEEHTYIMRMLKVVRNASLKILNGEEIVYEDFDKMIDFIRNYADEHHHGKEEKFLFQEMVNHLGKMGANLVTHGMLVEHDYGRLFIRELVEALDKVKQKDQEARLDVIANAIGYTNHLTRHIAKEDQVVYTYGARELPKEILDQVNAQTEDFEKKAREQGVQEYYIGLLTELEKKYE